jgi:DNA mismatch endonuclease (patch repair protein)
MVDVVDKKTRSRMMSGIQGKNTRPELVLRSGLHRLGFRFRLHVKVLPGKPDLVFPKYRALIQINGCFWHGHDCHLFKWPSTRKEFWRDKIRLNIDRDRRNAVRYQELGWRCLTIWECALKGKTRLGPEQVIEITAKWLQFDDQSAEIRGQDTLA